MGLYDSSNTLVILTDDTLDSITADLTGIASGNVLWYNGSNLVPDGVRLQKYTETIYSWTGSGPYTKTIAAATHGISVSPVNALLVACYELNGSDYDLVVPSVVRVEADGDVYIEMPTNSNLYVVIMG